jgi:hypothetical protein
LSITSIGNIPIIIYFVREFQYSDDLLKYKKSEFRIVDIMHD